MRASWVRVAGIARRVALATVVFAGATVIGVQFAGIVAKNVAVSRELDESRERIASLEHREVVQRRTIARLQTPEGAIPEIHENLRLVAPREELIEIRGLHDDRSPVRYDESQ